VQRFKYKAVPLTKLVAPKEQLDIVVLQVSYRKAAILLSISHPYPHPFPLISIYVLESSFVTSKGLDKIFSFTTCLTTCISAMSPFLASLNLDVIYFYFICISIYIDIKLISYWDNFSNFGTEIKLANFRTHSLSIFIIVGITIVFYYMY
jgi:hypothetical protein